MLFGLSATRSRQVDIKYATVEEIRKASAQVWQVTGELYGQYEGYHRTMKGGHGDALVN